ncbi:MAG TPA: sulfatase [Planctomycetota bacterium]|nr:sulfatase [Planctomycetota bacterium]
MRRPNIIFILIDDLGWRDLGCCGSTFYETPHLDRLASEGVRFTDAYAACPVCSPTRASILTGKYPARVGLTNYLYGMERGRVICHDYVDHLPLAETSLASTLRDAGYQTWHVGKWHLGKEPYWPEKHGFDVNVGGCDWGLPRNGYFSPWKNPRLVDGTDGEYLPDRLTTEAIRLIRERVDRPFFLNLWYYLVHIPVQPKPELRRKYEAKAAELGLDRKNPFEYGEYFPCEHKKHKQIVRRLFQSDPGYAAMVESLDENIGRLLAALDAEGLADDTVVIFTSDNGGLATAEGSPTSNAPLCEGKGWMFEGGTREPLIVRRPGVTRPGTLCHVPVTSPDFYPTLLEIAGRELMPAQHVDGVSFASLLGGADRLEREAIYWHYPHYGNQGGTPGGSVRSGDFKLIEFFEDRHVELYNLREDLGEEHDLAHERPDVVNELRPMLHAWLKEVDAKIPRADPGWNPRS